MASKSTRPWLICWRFRKHGVNWGAAVFALVVLVLLYGIIGLGPLAGLVEVAP